MLDQLSDAELIETYLANEARGLEYAAEKLGRKEDRL
jgi:hypothetical protein